jgi:hypothetical protein
LPGKPQCDQDLSLLYIPPWRSVDGLHYARLRGLELYLHLHRFDDRKDLSGLHLVADGYWQREQLAGKWCGYRVAICGVTVAVYFPGHHLRELTLHVDVIDLPLYFHPIVPLGIFDKDDVSRVVQY